MKIDLLIDSLHELIERAHYDSALHIVSQHWHYLDHIAFADCYATILYGKQMYEEAIRILAHNLTQISNVNDKENWLATTYFQIGNCELALGNEKAAADYYNQCLDYIHPSDPVYYEIKHLIPLQGAI